MESRATQSRQSDLVVLYAPPYQRIAEQFSLFLPIHAGVVFTALPRQLFWTTAGSPVYLYWYQYQSYPRSEKSSIVPR